MKRARLLLIFSLSIGACAPLEPGAPEHVGVQRYGVRVDQISGCSTSAVAALSAQLVAEQNCIKPDVLVSFASLAKVDVSSGVNALLEPVAVNALGDAANAASEPLSINSAFRTLAQQYLLKKWEGTCGITLAADPGNSNHETGIAVDVANWSNVKTAMEAHQWKWFGSADQVHFDFVGAGTIDLRGDSVLAFQRLWNRNHASDLIGEDGAWGPETESRLAESPSEGFAIGAICGAPTNDAGVVDLTTAMTTTDQASSIVADAAEAPRDLSTVDAAVARVLPLHPEVRGGCSASAFGAPDASLALVLVLALAIATLRRARRRAPI